nr:hypothetical protein [Tanacetum cinerariifolium]
MHAIQVGCQLCRGAHLDIECPLNKEVKRIEEVKYREFGRPFPNNNRNDGRFNRGISGYDQPSSGEMRPSLTKIINKYIEEAAKRHADERENLEWEELSLNDWIKIRYEKVCKMTKERILKDHREKGSEIRKMTLKKTLKTQRNAEKIKQMFSQKQSEFEFTLTRNHVVKMVLFRRNHSTRSRDRPPMLATGRYAQWQSHFLRYIDTRPNGDALRKCMLEGPYTSSTVINPVVPATDESLEVPEQRVVKTILNMSTKNKAHYELEKKSIHLPEFWKFTSHDGESMELYYSRFYKEGDTKPITPPSELASEEESDLKQAQRDKEMQKNLALIAKYFKKIYKPTNNNLKTSSNYRNKNVDTSPK